MRQTSSESAPKLQRLHGGSPPGMGLSPGGTSPLPVAEEVGGGLRKHEWKVSEGKINTRTVAGNKTGKKLKIVLG